MNQVTKSLTSKLQQIDANIEKALRFRVYGTIIRISGFLIEAVGLRVSIGSICTIIIASENETTQAEVVGFSENKTLLMSYDEAQGITPGNQIYCIDKAHQVPIGPSLLGRIIDGRCQPIDNKGPLKSNKFYKLYAKPINPIERNRINIPMDVGIKAINSLLTVGQGQRLGIFAGSGVGKSVLLGMMTRYTSADVVIIGLIGERGREVKEFIEESVGLSNLTKAIIIAAPVDTSPLERANGAVIATTIAEFFRNEGKNVLLIIDSLTRYAQALRQIYLVQGEMPSGKGYTPSVFAKISQLVERTGNGRGKQGSITAFYTVLTEGDDMNDPVADHARSILDGHIVLSRKLAESGHYPAIDISSSVSRVMPAVVSREHLQQVRRLRKLFSTYQENQDLIKMGMYHKGSDKVVDEAILFQDKIVNFLQQDVNDSSSFDSSLNQLMSLFDG